MRFQTNAVLFNFLFIRIFNLFFGVVKNDNHWEMQQINTLEWLINFTITIINDI